MITNKLYVIGGYPAIKSTFEIDATQKQITQKKDMIIGKRGHSLCTLHNQIFSIGGDNDRYSIADSEVYDSNGNTWKALPNLITPRRCCAAVIFGK